MVHKRTKPLISLKKKVEIVEHAVNNILPKKLVLNIHNVN
jgi:hypothetical protein